MEIYISRLICFFTRRGKKPELGSGYFALLEEVLFIFYISVCCCWFVLLLCCLLFWWGFVFVLRLLWEELLGTPRRIAWLCETFGCSRRIYVLYVFCWMELSGSLCWGNGGWESCDDGKEAIVKGLRGDRRSLRCGMEEWLGALRCIVLVGLTCDYV